MYFTRLNSRGCVMIKMKKSNLQIKDFKISGSYIQAIPETDTLKADVYNLPVNLDFDALLDENNSGHFYLQVNIQCNMAKKPKPGYSFRVSAQAEFLIEKESDDFQNLLQYSALPMVINNIRGYITNMTAQSWFGVYLLPTIDIVDLIKKKQATQG